MKPGKRFGLSAEQKIDVWRRWKAGQTLHQIGRAFGKEHSSIRCLVSRHGGIAPSVRRGALNTERTQKLKNRSLTPDKSHNRKCSSRYLAAASLQRAGV
jgi:hypothetical protein